MKYSSRLLIALCVYLAGVLRTVSAGVNAHELSEAEVVSRVSAIWDAELKGDTAEELRLANSVIESAGPDWALRWARGVVTRLTSLGKPVDIEFKGLDGVLFRSRQMRGKVILVSFWATWCHPCLQGLPKLKDLYSKRHADGLEIIGFSWDSDKDRLEKFLLENRIEWPIYFDGEKPGKWGSQFGVGGLPYILLFDRAGNLRYFGTDEKSVVESEIPKLMAERYDTLPNQSLEPTPKSVTDRAGARSAPAMGVAHH